MNYFFEIIYSSSFSKSEANIGRFHQLSPDASACEPTWRGSGGTDAVRPFNMSILSPLKASRSIHLCIHLMHLPQAAKRSCEETYLIDEEEDLDDVEIVVKAECEPPMV